MSLIGEQSSQGQASLRRLIRHVFHQHEGELKDLEVKIASEISNLMNDADFSLSSKELEPLVRSLLIVHKYHQER